MKLIVGLGNPGISYRKTRHNVGFIAVDKMLGNVKWENKFEGLIYINQENGEKYIYLKPQTYMNLSGISVKKVVDFYKILPEDIIIIHDDLDMQFGKVRIKKNSSAGGHNGIKSIIENIKTQDFTRIKIGIGKPSFESTKDYVLGKFTKQELEDLESIDYHGIINTYFTKGIDCAMNKYNG